MSQETYLKTLSDIEEMKKKAEIIRTQEIEATIESLRKSILIYGITPSDVFSREDLVKNNLNVFTSSAGQTDREPDPNFSTPVSSAISAIGSRNPPKFTNGKGLTWTGNGRKPQWFLSALSSGVAPEIMLISQNKNNFPAQLTAENFEIDSAKIGQGLKGAGKPRYTNGIGSTWTGNGRKPKWFLSALDSGVAPEIMLIAEDFSNVLVKELISKNKKSNENIGKGLRGPSDLKYTNGIGASWTGNGRQPKWFKDAISSGMAPKDMLISKLHSDSMVAATKEKAESADQTVQAEKLQIEHKLTQKNYLSAIPLRFSKGKWRILSGRGLKPRRFVKTSETKEKEPEDFLVSPSQGFFTNRSYDRKSQMAKIKQFIEKIDVEKSDTEASDANNNKQPRKKGPGYHLGVHSWTGVGPRPKWFKDALESGKMIEELQNS